MDIKEDLCKMGWYPTCILGKETPSVETARTCKIHAKYKELIINESWWHNFGLFIYSFKTKMVSLNHVFLQKCLHQYRGSMHSNNRCRFDKKKTIY